MAMTREEEKELRLSCSIGTLLRGLETREDLKMEPPPKEDSAEDGTGGVKRKAKDEEESEAMDFFLEETPDYAEDDPDWVVAEKKYLIEEYGKKIVSLGFDERDRFMYTCEICSVECNQRKMLEAHCLGMKHLRKKKLHDLKIQGKEVPDSFKITKSNSAKQTKPSGPDKPSDEDSSAAKKKKWKDSNNYYNYGQGNNPPFCNQPPPYGPPPGYGGAPPGFPPTGPPPGFYGQWPSNTPNIFNTPPPTLDASKATNKNSLAGGDTGSLLQKLADCAVKNDKDSELAINVVIALMKSLKDFNHKRGETKFIEVLTEADVTFRILKTLKPANKEEEPVPAPSTSDVLQDQNSSSSTTCGVSDFAQSAPSNTQSSNYPVNNQYYNSQSNPSSNTGYNYGTGTGPDYSSQVPTGCPPPSATSYNPQGTNGYAQEGTDQNYGQNTAYSNQGSASSNQANNQSYPTQNYSNQGYGNEGANTQNYSNQGYGNQGQNPQQAPSGYYNQQGQANSQVNSGYSNQGQAPYSQPTGDYYKGTPNTQSTEDSNPNQGVGQKDVGGESNQQSGNAQTPAPSATPTTPAASDSSTPDFSNYGYAAGYSMGYYNVPPPTYNHPY